MKKLLLFILVLASCSTHYQSEKRNPSSEENSEAAAISGIDAIISKVETLILEHDGWAHENGKIKGLGASSCDSKTGAETGNDEVRKKWNAGKKDESCLQISLASLKDLRKYTTKVPGLTLVKVKKTKITEMNGDGKETTTHYASYKATFENNKFWIFMDTNVLKPL